MVQPLPLKLPRDRFAQSYNDYPASESHQTEDEYGKCENTMPRTFFQCRNNHQYCTEPKTAGRFHGPIEDG